MASKDLIACVVLVSCSSHTGYRRAGIALANGKNYLPENTITKTQLAQLKADHRLAVVEDPDSTEANSGEEGEGTLVHVPSSDGLTLLQAIAKLSPDNADHFTNGGKPQTDALANLVGEKVSAAERDAAWEEYQAQEAAAQ